MGQMYGRRAIIAVRASLTFAATLLSVLAPSWKNGVRTSLKMRTRNPVIAMQMMTMRIG